MKELRKIKTIAESFINKLPLEEEWYQNRLDICAVCPKNTDNMEFLSGDLKVKTRVLCPETRACSACGCCIDRKASVKSEVCGLVEIGEEPKWSAIEIESKKDKNLKVENLRLNEITMSVNDLGQYEAVVSTDKPKIDFEFKLTRGNKIEVREVVKTCSCTSSDTIENPDGTTNVIFTISTKGFTQNKQVSKTIVVKYIVNNHPREIEFKAKITKL
jgi:hypothetical protein